MALSKRMDGWTFKIYTMAGIKLFFDGKLHSLLGVHTYTTNTVH